MGKPKHDKKFKQYYIPKAVVMIIATISVWACLFVSREVHNSIISTTFLYISVGCLILCLFGIFDTAKKIIFKDQFTTFGNVNHAMKFVMMKTKKGKIVDYNSLFVNIKDLKYINQRYGVENGDLVIKEYAEVLDGYFETHKGVVGRMGGDNFLAVVRKTDYEDFLKFLANIYLPITLQNGEVREIGIKFRAGVNIINSETAGRSTIFYSSMALSTAKETLRDIVIFDPPMLERFVHSKKIIADAINALKNDEFIPYYQPKVDIKTGALCGCEALIRWKKNDTLITPNEFIPILEKNGIITDVDFFVFEAVCKDIKKWLAKGIEPVRISTNFSKLHLQDPQFINRIIEIKDAYGIDGKYLEVELTETANITEFNIIQKFSEQIRQAGMKISIDDFGTGYSSLSLLQSIKADVVKMDKSFLDNCFNGGSKQFLIDVINIVKHQDEEVLFEGVEEREQFEFLKENGCDIIQGFYFDRPLCHDEFEIRLQNPCYTV